MAGSQLQRRTEAAASQAPARVSIEDAADKLIQQQQVEIARALPSHIRPEAFARHVVTVVKANPKLLGADRFSLLASVMEAASLGLEPGSLGHVYFVPFNTKLDNGQWGDKVQMIIGWKGYVDLARRSGLVDSLYAEVVYEGDEFDYELGLRRDLRHRRTPGSNRAHVTHAYAVAHYKGGGFDFRVLDEVEIAARRQRSQTGAVGRKQRDGKPQESKGPWVDDFDAMARKSAIRALAPYLPLTVEMGNALAHDEQAMTLGERSPEPVPVESWQTADPETGEIPPVAAIEAGAVDAASTEDAPAEPVYAPGEEPFE